MNTTHRAWVSLLADALRLLASPPAAPADPLRRAAAAGGWRKEVRRLLPVFRTHRPLFLAGSLCLAASIAAGLFPPLFARDLVDEVLLGGRIERLAFLLVVLGLLFAAEKLLRLCEECLFALFERRMLRDLEDRLLRVLPRLPQELLDRRRSGYLARRVGEDIEGLRPLLSGLPARTAGQALRLAGGAAFLVFLEWRVALAVLVFFPALALLLRRASRALHRLSHRRLEDQAEAAGLIQETIALADQLQSPTAAENRRGAILSAFERQLEGAFLLSLLSALTTLAIQSVPALARALALTAGAFLIHRGEWSVGGLLAFQGYLGHCFGPAQHLATVQLELERARAALERLGALLDAPAEPVASGRKPGRLLGEIEFRGVSFAYGPGPPVLEGLSFRLAPGGALAVLGPSGIGKTTLLALIRGRYAPSSGGIFYDGRPAAAYDPAVLRERIGFVPQEPRLLAGSVLENLRLDRPQATLEEAMRAAREAGIHEEILSLPSGYETSLGEGGVGLSAGQRQRLALARALLSDPDILVLDEPTAFLDEAAEEIVLAALARQKGRRTLIVVTHRAAAARLCEEKLIFRPAPAGPRGRAGTSASGREAALSG